VLDPALDHEFRRDALITGPRRHQPAAQRDAVEYLDLGPTLDDQALDDIEAVEFASPACDLGEVPAWRRRGPSDAMAMVQRAPTSEDAVDGPLRGEWLDPSGSEPLPDRLGAGVAQVALGPQLAAYLEDQVFDGAGGPLGGAGDRRAIGPIHPVEALAVGMANPAIDGGGAHAELTGDLLLRTSASDGFDDGSTAGRLPIGLLMVRSSSEVWFQVSLHRERSACRGSQPFRRSWQLAGYGKWAMVDE
jgi:hypothetical protein